MKRWISAPDLMSQVIESSPVGYLLFDRAGKCVMANRAAREILDLSWEGLEGRSYSWVLSTFSDAHLGKEDLGSASLQGDKAESPGGRTVRVSHRALGDGKHDLMNLEVIQGSGRGWTAVQEESLQRLTSNTQALHSFPIAVALSDLEGNLTFVNHSFLRLWGYQEEEEVLGSHIQDLLGYDHSEMMSSIEESGNWFGEMDAYRRDGSSISVQISVGRVHDPQGSPIGTMSSFVDVSDRSEVEGKLMEREQQLSTIIQNLPRGMASILSADFRILYAEGELLEDLGLSGKWVVGSHLTEVLPAHAAEMSMTNLQSVLNGGRRTFELELNDLCLLMRAAPLRDSRGRIDRILVLGTDMSEQKRVQNQLMEAKDALAWSNRELKQFAYVASHDLQEPLRKINSFTGLLSKRYKGQIDEKADKYIRYIVDASQRMSDLLDDLLSYSRVVNQDKRFEEVDLEEVLQMALQDLESKISESGGRVTHDPLPTVSGVRNELVQVFENLISNALKFRGEDPPQVHVSARDREGRWLFSVRDDGIGMDTQYSDRIFTIFQRLHTKEEYPGTGIGLSLVSRIVERHNGEIWMESEPGEGSTFFFTLNGHQADQETTSAGGIE
ncbi:MAG: PAS domain S-box protein [Methanomassiliicoccales archaeon]